MSYNKYFEINKNFQSSINLELDLDDQLKMYEYIPTSDICDVLKRYVKSALGKSKERATTLIGPYGKGKSFLLLVLSFIFSKDKDSVAWIDLANRIKKIDLELFNLLGELKKKQISLIPVIINSNYDNIEQSFMMALVDALKREKIEDITPETAYTEALNILNNWKKDSSISNDLLNQCIKNGEYEIDEVRKGLKNYSKEAYDKFCNIYYCITHGVNFNPFVSSDITKIYSDISVKIGKFGYSGLFVVFDEFSKYIESTSIDVSKGLKLVQDLAEKCTRTDTSSQLHMCCVAHKTISLYKDNKKDSFKAVEGRFTEIRFNRSLDENYQIISAAIKRKSGASTLAESFVRNNSKKYKNITELGIFSDQNIYSEVFPLNPLTTYALIQLSELVAQNERTLYTFLSDTDDNSFNSFIHEKDSGLFNVDKIYDYFAELLQKEEANYIRNLWYRAESILSKLESPLQKRIVKTLAIILMINDLDKLPSTNHVISLALFEDEETISQEIDKLINKSYLRNNLLNNMLSFALSNTKNLDDKILILKKTKFKNFDSSSLCDQIYDKKYLIPRRHNAERKITRFYKTVFLSEEEFLNLNSFDIFFDKYYCDGVVVNILKYKILDETIDNKVRDIGNDRVVVCYPKKAVSPILEKELIRYACLRDIENQGSLDELTAQEVVLLTEETTSNIKSLLDKHYDKDVKFVHCKNKNKNLSELLSTILDEYYDIPLIFNNELVNKKIVTTQYQKAVNNIIECLIDSRRDDDFNPTSPEASVKYSILEFNKNDANFRLVIDSIKQIIMNSEGKKCDFASSFGYLEERPYGIRKGIIPILVAKAISELSDDVILYYEKKEMVLNAQNLVKAIGKDTYYLSFARGSKEQHEYIDKMMKLFDTPSSNSFRLDIISLSKSIKKYFMGLPNVVRACRTIDYLGLTNEMIDIKNLYLEVDINPFEAVCLKPLKILGTSSYTKLFNYFKTLDSNIAARLEEYKVSIVNSVKEIFGIDRKTSLKAGLTSYLNNCIKKNEKLILSDVNKQIQNVILTKTNYDDSQVINELSKCITNNYIEDWENDNSLKVVDVLASFIDNISKANKFDISQKGLEEIMEDSSELDGMAALLCNNVESAIEEFSDSVSNEDKVKILTRILKKYL